MSTPDSEQTFADYLHGQLTQMKVEEYGTIPQRQVHANILERYKADRLRTDKKARLNELLHVYDTNALYFYDDNEEPHTVGDRIRELQENTDD